MASTGRLSLAQAVSWLFLLGWLLTACQGALANHQKILIVTSDDSRSTQEAIRAITDGLMHGQQEAPKLTVLGAEALQGATQAAAEVIVTLGVKAAQAVAAVDQDTPVLAVLIPRSAFERIVPRSGRGNRPFSAVFIDQPLSRQIDLLRLALPGRNRIGVLIGPGSAEQLRPLQALARQRNLHLAFERVDAEDALFPALQRVLAASDALLALPDPAVFNAQTLQNILLAAYRNGTPLIAFSPAYVRAGALLAVYSSPTQLGQQAAEILRRGRQLPPPQHPKYFSIGVNPHVARSLGLLLEDGAALENMLKEMERAP